MNYREAERYLKRILKQYGIEDDDVSYFGSYSCGYFDSHYKESMTEEECLALWNEAYKAADKYVKWLNEAEK